MLPEGTKVKVVASESGHEFPIGSICVRKIGCYEEPDCLGFELLDEKQSIGIWCMKENEYQLLDSKAQELHSKVKNAQKELEDYLNEISQIS